jgi:regulator of PEP synthase PpsR (kinase-PPPase family)
MDAVLAQYAGHEARFRLDRVYSDARTLERLAKILDEVDPGSLIIFSLIEKDLRQYFHRRLHEKELLHLNVLEPMLSTMTKFLGFHPEFRPGLLQIIDDKYYEKIDAIGFTVEHDDGLGHQINEADLVIIGPSRTCKTPISMYLACNYGMKVANIPTVQGKEQERRLLDHLKNVDDRKIIGLTMRVEVLAQVREERSVLLVDDDHASVIDSYTSIEQIEKELKFVRILCNRQCWEMVNVTRRAIEEISAEILAFLVSETVDMPGRG